MANTISPQITKQRGLTISWDIFLWFLFISSAINQDSFVTECHIASVVIVAKVTQSS